jgi:2-oxo-3-hexenedioate decarboxylase
MSTPHASTISPRRYRVAPYAEPKIEPEIVVGLSAAPSPDMDDAALLGCIGWLAHGFEIVQSVFPNWKFTAPTASP